MKTQALKSLCKQAQNECRVVIAGALLILPKDLVLIVRFAGLFSPCRFLTLFIVTASRSPSASRSRFYDDGYSQSTNFHVRLLTRGRFAVRISIEMIGWSTNVVFLCKLLTVKRINFFLVSFSSMFFKGMQSNDENNVLSCIAFWIFFLSFEIRP